LSNSSLLPGQLMIVSVIWMVVLAPLYRFQVTFFPLTENPLSEEAEHTSEHTSLAGEAVALGVRVGGTGVLVGATVSVGATVGVGEAVFVGVAVHVGEGPIVGVKVIAVGGMEVGVLLGNVPIVAEGAGASLVSGVAVGEDPAPNIGRAVRMV